MFVDLSAPVTSGLLVVLMLGSAATLFAVAATGTTGLEQFASNPARRILTNSATPIAAQLFNRVVDLLFAAFALRILGVRGNGEYAIATVTWLYLKTISDFGLSILVAREVARHPHEAGSLVGSTTLLRLLILLMLGPVVLFLVALGPTWLDLSPASLLAILLLTAALIPSSYAEAINSVFTGLERLHLPAVLTVFTNLIRFSAGLFALAHGCGVPGIAGAAVFATVCNALALHVALRRLSITPEWRLSKARAKTFVREAWPLLLNGLLITLFFRLDTFVIQAIEGSRALGIYDAAYKLPNLLPIIPSYFVMAVFPMLSRQSGADLRRTFELGARFLVLLGWLVVLVTLPAAPLFIEILGGRAFLPDAAHTLRILVWFAPLHYLNGIAQYAVIAANRQRDIAPAYGIATIFNFAANLVTVPMFGYNAAAMVTVLTEIVLFVALRRSLQRCLGPVHWSLVLWRPTLAFGLAVLVYFIAPNHLVMLPLLIIIFVASLWMAGALSVHDVNLLRLLLPR